MATTKTKKAVKKTSTKKRTLQPAKPKLFGLISKAEYRLALPSAWKIFKQSLRHLWAHKKLFAGISVIYLLLILLLAKGFGLTTDFSNVTADGKTNTFSSAFTALGFIVGNNGTTDAGAAVYQLNILVLTSLAVIWALRQTYAKQKVGIKDVFYRSTYPLIPFILVLLVIALQSIPWVLGSFLFNAAVLTGVAKGFLPIALCSLAAGLLLLWSLYLVSSSLFALYIVTLPDMKPLQALRAAKKLVKYRRWSILRKLLYLPVALIIIFSTIMLSVILVVAPLAEVVFMILSTAALVIFHSYIYSLYRELL